MLVAISIPNLPDNPERGIRIVVAMIAVLLLVRLFLKPHKPK